MDDPNVILTLTPNDKWGLAIDSFHLPHNSIRYVKPSPISRETTPDDSINDEHPVNDLEYFHRIQLRFDHETKIKGRVTFGGDPDRCDVLLVSRRPQFYITFDSEQRPVIWDDSNNGLTVSYDGQANGELRNHFKWIFFPENQTITVTIRLPKQRELAFDVHLSKHCKAGSKEYKNNMKMFMAGAPQEYEVSFDNLALRSQGTSFAPSESFSPTKRPIYLKRKEVGKGAFGQVWKVVNASTGYEYAGKEFFNEKGWEKEIEIMKHLYHDHIVQFIDFRQGPKPLLVMEYLRLGSLKIQHKVSSISENDMMAVFNQCLKGLSHLHEQNITHRDLKPENILLRSRTPIHIKLADFGLAQDRSDLKTFCGSPTYAAPEIFLGQHYTDAVDIWSLAVIVMKFMYGLRQYKELENLEARRELQLWGQAWCRFLIKAADDWDSDKVIDFLTKYMLRWEPQERLSAAKCLKTASKMGLFDGTFLQTGYDTPRLQPTGAADDTDTEEASTIMGPLWQDNGARGPPFDSIPLQPHTNSDPLSPLQLPRKSIGDDTLGLGPDNGIDKDSIDPEINFSDTDVLLQISRPPFSFMTPSHPSQRSGQEGPEYPARGMLYHTPIPPLPYSSVNSIDNSGAVERGNNLLSQTIHNVGDQVNSNIDPLLYGFEHTQGPRDEEDLASASEECYKITVKRKRSMNHHNSSQVPDQLPDAAKQRVDNAASSRPKLGATGDFVRPLPAPHSIPILVNDPPGYITITVDGKSVSLRQKDSWLNATQIVNMAGRTVNQRAGILKKIARTKKIDVQFFHGRTSSWVAFEVGVDLCYELGITESLKPLLQLSSENNQICPTNDRLPILSPEFLPDLDLPMGTTSSEKPKRYFQIETNGTVIHVRKADYWINATNIWKITGKSRQAFMKVRNSLQQDQYSVVYGPPAQGTYVDVQTALDWCMDWGLNVLRTLIETALKDHGYRGDWSQQNDQHPPPINDPLLGLLPESTLTNSPFFPQAGKSFFPELYHPIPSPQEVVRKSRSQLSTVNSFHY